MLKPDKEGRKNSLRYGCKKEKIGSCIDLRSHTNPSACIRLFPYQTTIRLFTVTKMPTNSIICFVRAHLSSDAFIVGAT